MNASLGAFGESWAAGYLRRQGYRVVDRNVRFRNGEIDIVAWDGEELVFVEVKCRRSTHFGPPAAAITPAKYQRLALAAQEYMAVHDLEPEAFRIDVVAVQVGRSGRVDHHELLRAVEPPVR